MEAKSRVSIIRETVRGLRGDTDDRAGPDKKCTKLSSSAAFERIQRLLAASTESEAVDEVYEHLMLSATDVLMEDYEGFGQCVDLLKRALLRHLPSYEQLQRINVWCEATVRNVNSSRAETSKAIGIRIGNAAEGTPDNGAVARTRSRSHPTQGSGIAEGGEVERQPAHQGPPKPQYGDNQQNEGVLLVNSLKFLKRLVGRHIDTWKEQQTLSDPNTTSAASSETDECEGKEEEEEEEINGSVDGAGTNDSKAAEAGLHLMKEEQSYPHSALSQLYGNMDNARRRSSSHEILAHMQISSRNPHQLDSMFNKNGEGSSSSGEHRGGGTTTSELSSLGRPEEEQNKLFKELLEDRDRSVGDLNESVRLVLTHMMEMYERDPQQTFVVVSIFLQEMLMENTVTIQRRAFDIFLNLVFHWQNCVALSCSSSSYSSLSSNALQMSAEQGVSAALALRDAMWHASLLNEMCLVLLDCGMEVDASVWECAHACILFCCAKEGLLVPKLVKMVSFEILKKLLEVCHTSAWSPASEGTIISMVTSHILPYRGNHLGLDSSSLQLLGGEKEIVRLIRDLRSPASLANLFCVIYFMVCHAINGPAITLTGDHVMNANMDSLTSLLQSGLHLRLSQALQSESESESESKTKDVKRALSDLGSELEAQKKYPKHIVNRLMQFFHLHSMYLS